MIYNYFKIELLITLICLVTRTNAQIQVNGVSVTQKQKNKKKESHENIKTLTLEECEFEYLDIIHFIDLKKGDIVADIGSANGEDDIAMSTLCDSVTFYLEDLNPRSLDTIEINFLLNHYTKIRKTPQSNVFISILGNERKTNLPNGLFDKIIIRNAFHEFTYIYSMLNDIYEKLKPNGKLIIEDMFSFKGTPYIIKGCETMAYTEKELIEIMSSHQLYPTDIFMASYLNENILIFSKNKIGSENYTIKKEKRNQDFRYLELIDSSEIAIDSTKMNAIADSLKTMSVRYPIIESVINTYGYNYLTHKKYPEAIRVFKINCKLYPFSFNVYDSLGEAYKQNNQYQLALMCYEKCAELHLNDKHSQQQIKKLKKLIQ